MVNNISDILVSIVIPMYNAENYFRDTLHSIINQTHHRLEILIIDDGSTDNSINIANEYAARDGRIRIYSQQNKGAAEARNWGISLLTGQYVLFLDADDLFAEDMVSTMLVRAQETEADVVICNFESVLGTSEKEQRLPITVNESTREQENLKLCNSLASTGFDIKTIQRYVNPLCCSPRVDSPDHAFQLFVSPAPWNKLFRTKHINTHNLRFVSLSSTNDLTFVLSACIIADRVSFIDKHLVKYRLWPNSLSHSRKRNIENTPTALAALLTFLKTNNLWPALQNSFSELVSCNMWFNLMTSFATPDEVRTHIKKWTGKLNINTEYLTSVTAPFTFKYLSVFAPEITLIIPEIKEKHLPTLQPLADAGYASLLAVQILYGSPDGEKLYTDKLSFPAAMPVTIAPASSSSAIIETCKTYAKAPLVFYPGADTTILYGMLRSHKYKLIMNRLMRFFTSKSSQKHQILKSQSRILRSRIKDLSLLLYLVQSYT